MIHVVCTACVAVAAAVCLYHAFLALVALAGRKPPEKPSSEALHSFAIVIPAHNEEGTIDCALRSCGALDYPKEKFTVYVVADNCSDQTAEMAMAYGAVCLVRRDEQNRGKGQALEWALPRILPHGHDAVVILDADCQLGTHALKVFDHRLLAGERVLQASDVVANPDENAMSYTLAVANVLENDLFYTPKSTLGLAVFLRGTGMVFRRDVLANCPWRALSIAEDAEYTCQLLKQGILVSFVPEVRVASRFPVQQRQLVVQRTRWVGGGVSVARTRGLELLWRGVVRRRPVLPY